MKRDKVLVVDDEPNIVEALTIALEEQYDVLGATSGTEGLALLARNPDSAVIITDQRMPGMSGTEFLEKTLDTAPMAVRIILTGYTDIESLVEAINAGKVYHYITKPWQPGDLRVIVRRAVEYRGLLQERGELRTDLLKKNEALERTLAELKEAQEKLMEAERRAFAEQLREKEEQISVLSQNLTERHRFDSLVGRSSAMQKVYRLIETVSPSDVTVLIQGESGTGKEMVAKAIHFNGARKDKPFVAQNCAALTETLLDSELFGHARGAFTGAIRDKRGLFDVASEGTLFLDEVGEMSAALQVKLLRVLQDGSYTRVGDDGPRTTRARIISATNRDLFHMAQQKKFRDDLYYRLHVVQISLPPLRDRKEDLPMLVRHFAEKRGKNGRMEIHPNLLEAFDRYDWPGNVRELEHEIERMITLHPGASRLTADMVSERLRTGLVKRSRVKRGTSMKDITAEVEEGIIRDGLERTRGNKARLARELGLSRKGLLDKMVRLKIPAPPRRRVDK
ncbi:MAG: sigma 54-interacting transcriptional regulator [Nitrospirae bacterium]|nr:sigma 54-interacting transcriptional regulator [Nitrospirota bacterium]